MAFSECGRTSQRIVGGEPARISDYPFTAALTRGGSRPYCGMEAILAHAKHLSPNELHMRRVWLSLYGKIRLVCPCVHQLPMWLRI